MIYVSYYRKIANILFDHQASLYDRALHASSTKYTHFKEKLYHNIAHIYPLRITLFKTNQIHQRLEANRYPLFFILFKVGMVASCLFHTPCIPVITQDSGKANCYSYQFPHFPARALAYTFFLPLFNF
jgi:hypothetical protein